MAQGKAFTPQERVEIIEKVLDGLREGLPEYKACVDSGCSYPTWFNWRQQTPGLNERIREAQKSRIPLLVDALYKTALRGSVTAILTLLEKEDPEWAQRAKDNAPRQNVLIINGGLGQMLAMMEPEKKKKFLGSLHMAGLLPDNIVDVAPSENGNSNGSANGNGTH